MTGSKLPQRDKAAIGVLFAVFLISRIAYFEAGLRFNTVPLRSFWQNVDPILLRTDLWRSIWYLHMQPPLYNLLNGLVLQLFPQSWGTALHAIYAALGLVISMSLFLLMRWLGASTWIAAGLTALFLASPPTLLYENIGTYEYPVLCLVLLSVLALIALVEEPGARSSAVFFACFAALAITRSFYHLAFLLIAAVAAVWLSPRAVRRPVAIAALPFLLLTVGLYAKNGILFHRFTSSTWYGMEIGVITIDQLTPQEARQLVAGGRVSPLAEIKTFSPFAVYQPYIGSALAGTGVPILDRVANQSGSPNFNALAYLDVHAGYMKDALATLRYKPVVLTRALASSWFCFFRPASDLQFYFGEEAEPIHRWERLFSAVAFGQFRRTEDHAAIRDRFFHGRVFEALAYTGVWMVVLVPVVLAWGLWETLSKRRPAAQRVVMGFLLFHIFIVMLMANLAVSETNRYRFTIDPFFLVLGGLMLESLRTGVPWRRQQPQRKQYA